MDSTLTVAILVVSTTAAKDPSTDAATSVLTDVLRYQGLGKWTVQETKIVTDNVEDIKREVISWTDSDKPVSLVITTGGTGFAVSDSTPEV